MAKVTTVPVMTNKLVIELNEKEAAVLFAMLSCTSGNIVAYIYHKFRELGFDSKELSLGKLDVWSIEGKLDKYITVPDSLKANNV